MPKIIKIFIDEKTLASIKQDIKTLGIPKNLSQFIRTILILREKIIKTKLFLETYKEEQQKTSTIRTKAWQKSYNGRKK